MYCSRVKPAVISPGPNGARAFVLGPYNLKPDRETTNFYAFYFGLCVTALMLARQPPETVAGSRLSFSTPALTQSQMVTLRSAEEIISNYMTALAFRRSLTRSISPDFRGSMGRPPNA